jgi:hypothetical protein
MVSDEPMLGVVVSIVGREVGRLHPLWFENLFRTGGFEKI